MSENIVYVEDLFDAIAENNLSLVQYLLAEGWDINQMLDTPFIKKGTPLMYASSCGYYEIVKFLVENKADINAQNENERTALMCASAKGFKDIVELLINKGALINLKVTKKGFEGQTALRNASNLGHKEVAEILIENGAEYDLLILARLGDVKRAIGLINMGYDINTSDEHGATILMITTQKGNKEFAELLIKKGADINAHDKDGYTPLMCASINGSIEIVDLLIRNGADINQKTNKGSTALFTAIIGHNTEIVSLLLNNGAEPNIKSYDFRDKINGSTPLTFAKSFTKFDNEIIKLLIQAGAKE